MSLNKMRKLNRKEFGFSLIELLIVVTIIGLIVAIAVPSLASSRRAANAASAVQSLRAYHSAQMTFQGGKGFLIEFDLLRSKTDGVDEVLGFSANNVIKSGYIFKINSGIYPDTDPSLRSLAVLPDGTAVYQGYYIQANPIQLTGVAATGKISYYIDYSGVIHQKIGVVDAGVTDPALGSGL